MLAKKDEQWDKVERGGLEPDRDVMTIGDLIYYRYAEIIAKSAFGVPEGRGQGQTLRVREGEVQGIGRRELGVRKGRRDRHLRMDVVSGNGGR